MLKRLPFKVECIQTDNGMELTKRLGSSKNPTPTLFEARLEQCGIQHKLIRPYTLINNGKVKRSHRKYNNFPMRPLNWKSPADYTKAFIEDGEIF